MKQLSTTPLEVTHHQDHVVETYLDSDNGKVIELYHRSGNRRDRIEYSTDTYLQQYANYPIGKRVLHALIQ